MYHGPWMIEGERGAWTLLVYKLVLIKSIQKILFYFWKVCVVQINNNKFLIAEILSKFLEECL